MSSAQPTGSALIPSLRYQDAHAAIAWLERAFGLVRHAVHDGPNGTVAHAQLTFAGTGMIMLGSAANPSPRPEFNATPAETGGRVTSGLYLVVPARRPQAPRSSWNSAPWTTAARPSPSATQRVISGRWANTIHGVPSKSSL
jgi:uncharacterized glyoxalase superfamily protein PhnB